MFSDGTILRLMQQAKIYKASSEEWVEFWAEANQNPSGEIVGKFCSKQS